MARVTADRVRETSATTGIGPVTPTGVISGGFSTIGSKLAPGDTAEFCVADGSGNWNVMIGTWDGTTVTRTIILDGSSGLSPVDLTGVGVEIWITVAADWIADRANIPAAGLALSDGATLAPATIGGGLQLAASTLQSALPRNVQSGSYALLASDRGKIVEFTGSAASTITLLAAATAGAGWWCILKHSGTGTTGATKRLAISGTLDAILNPAVYPGDTRIIQSDGANLTSVLLKGGYIEILNSDSPFTLTLPPGDASHEWDLWGGGGGGGSGRRGAAGGIRAGGSGGGGGSKASLKLRTAQIGATVLTVTVAGTAAGGSSIGVDTTNGANGTIGNNTTLGALLTAFGGGLGFGGLAANNSGGGGAGVANAGGAGGTGGSTGGGASSASIVGHFTGGGTAAGGAGQNAGVGGGSGGGTASTTTGGAGGSSIEGGAGGGGGGAIDATNNNRAGGAGGARAGVNGGGGTGGLSGSGTSGSAGTAGPSQIGPGTGGGGGGAGNLAGGSGGNGGIACGGGGGAASLNGNASGAGGLGGAGLARYEYGP